MAAVTELVDRLCMIKLLDAAIGRIKGHCQVNLDHDPLC
jgi:hypothetical protein